MKILITDDEPLARTRLRSLIGEIGQLEIIGEAANGKEALLLSDQLQPDLVLLDIRMPGIDGLETAAHLAEYDPAPAVIFTTAYGDHALAAFEANAVDYLVKPIRKQRLEQALTKAQRLDPSQWRDIRENEGLHEARSHICAHSRGAMHLVPVNEIIFCRADHKYVTVHYHGGEVLIEEALKALEQEFAEYLVRIHRNTLIARPFLAGLEKNTQGHDCVILRDSQERPEVSRRHISSVRKIIRQFSS